MTSPLPQTLPGSYYYDVEVHEREKECVFYRTWQYVGHVSMLAEPSTYLVREIADESIIVMRDNSSTLRAVYNVCQHRAHRLLEGEGALRPFITCPYHSWTYEQSGALRSAREADTIKDFDRSAICLQAVRLEELCGFLFVNLDNEAQPLSALTPGLENEIRDFSPNSADLVIAKRYDIDLAANWKNSVENFSECYHCINRHPTLAQNALDLETYKIECYDHFHIHRSRNKAEAMGYNVDVVNAARPNEFRSFLIWPNTVIEVYPGGNLTVFHHVPVGPERTLQRIEWYFPSAHLSDDEQAIIDFIHTIRLEDVPICESVQRGLHSRGYGRGHLVVGSERSDASEHAVLDFQQKIVAALDPKTKRN